MERKEERKKKYGPSYRSACSASLARKTKSSLCLSMDIVTERREDEAGKEDGEKEENRKVLGVKLFESEDERKKWKKA